MPIPHRRELAAFLEEFAANHRGVRLGKMFGLPAVYAGRRLFACLIEEGVIVRVPEDVAKKAVKTGARPYSPSTRSGARRPFGTWIMYEPRTAAAARRLTPVLEVAARNVARRQTEELTGVKFL
jgi:hypothetical protein